MKPIRFDQIFPAATSTVGATLIAGVTADSRQVKPGFVFVASRGESQDGHEYIAQAQENGAAVIVGERGSPHGLLAPYVRVSDGRLALAELATAFYAQPSRAMKMVGVTGTSGKTTTTYLIESVLKAAGEKVGLIGTVSIRYAGKTLDATHTTPGAVELQAVLSEMRNAGCTAVVMEVSSHALKQHRVAGIAWDAMVFTNLSPEHLDFHPDMEDYYRAKAMLFTDHFKASKLAGKNPAAVVATDTEFGERLAREIRPLYAKLLTTALEDGDSELSGRGVQVGSEGIRGEAGGVKISSKLTSLFNVSNILSAVGVGLGLGIAPDAIERGILTLEKVPGRLEAVANERGIRVFVDYAHKSDALEKVLKNLRNMKGASRLITVFGCGGDRDRGKRPVMGRLAVELSDQVFITSDNPRTENPLAIIEEILKGTAGHANFKVEPDRRKAIFAAIASARPGDLVLIAGKGHEDYQIIGKTKIHFDDREVAAEALQSY